MLSPANTARIKNDIAQLEKARDGCSDNGIRKVIQGWIAEQKQALASGAKKEP